MSTSARRLSGSPVEFITAVSNKIMAITGVQLGEKQRAMVESRLKKRMGELQFSEMDEYEAYFNSNETSETAQLISLLTTHHTYFFREFAHFEFLSEKFLPLMIPVARKRADKTIRIWSAACSRGQEVYSLAMYLKFHLKTMAPDLKFSIMGTDVDPQSVGIASNGVYHRREIREAPMNYLADFWARGTGDIAEFVKAKAPLREGLSFKPMNLLELKGKLPGEKFDLIFCRNVFIYFTPEQISSTSNEFVNHLSDEGVLILGISETLNGLGVPVVSKGPSIYTRPTNPLFFTKPVTTEKTNVTPLPSATAQPVKNQILRVFCVDDSSSIHTLLKQVLRKEDGFEIVGTALNGVEAAKKIKEVGQVDVMTLDIHMPEMNGVEYLEKHFGNAHPPVVMLTSVSRDNADLAFRSLKLGASDFIEKPTLNNLAERGDEIRSKLKSAFKAKAMAQGGTNLSLDSQFKKSIVVKNPANKARVLICGLGDESKIVNYLKDLSGDQPPFYIFVEGAAEALPQFAQRISSLCGKTLKDSSHATMLKPGEIGLFDFKTSFETVKGWHKGHRTALGVFGEISKAASQKVVQWTGTQILLEDLGGKQGAEKLQSVANDIFPATSFGYVSSEFLGAKE